MSNKKRIRKLIQTKYKPSRKVILLNEYVHGWDFAIAFEEAAKDAEKAAKEYLKQIRTTSRADFQKQYLNDPIQTGVVHKAVVFIDGNLPEKELTKIVDKLERIRTNKKDLF